MPLRRRGQHARSRPDRRVAVRPSRHRPFEVLVEQALDRIPARFQPLLDEVAIVIEDEPTDEQLDAHDLGPDGTLYGLYEGTPIVDIGADWSATPNKISLFRLPLEEDFPDPDELAAEVRRTVLHELAHHVGFEDHRLHELGLD